MSALSARHALAALFMLSGACHHPAPPPPVVVVPTPVIPDESPWPATLGVVRAAVSSGRFAAADSVLTAFEAEHGGTPEAEESAFWRVLVRTDPRNPAFAPADARAALDGYLARGDAQRRVEAEVLRRMLATIDSLRTAQTSLRTAAEARDRAREEELQKVRDELQRTQAELDRIKRRLGSPKP